MTRIIAIMNQKGGVGKTTTAISIATGLQSKGYRTLLIDTDKQCNASDTYNAIIKDTTTLYDLFFNSEDAFNCIQSTNVGEIIPSDPLMQDAEQLFPNDNSRSFIMRESLNKIENTYDFIIVDTPPSMGVVLSNVLTYAHEIIIPVTCDRYGLVGITQLHKIITTAQKYTNTKLEILGLLLIKHNERLNICKEIMQSLPKIAEVLNTKVFNSKIRESVSCRESQSERMSIFEYEKTSTTAIDYMKLCDEIERIK